MQKKGVKKGNYMASVGFNLATLFELGFETSLYDV
jgi:hypothetical protein